MCTVEIPVILEGRGTARASRFPGALSAMVRRECGEKGVWRRYVGEYCPGSQACSSRVALKKIVFPGEVPSYLLSLKPFSRLPSAQERWDDLLTI